MKVQITTVFEGGYAPGYEGTPPFGNDEILSPNGHWAGVKDGNRIVLIPREQVRSVIITEVEESDNES